MKTKLFITCALLFVLTGVANAVSILHLGDPPNTGAYLYGEEVRPISETNLGIMEMGPGQPQLLSPLLLILGVPNLPSEIDPTYSAPQIASLSQGTASAPMYGEFFTSAATGDVYSFLGLSGGNNSNSFTNWSNAELAVNGISVEGFGMFVYELYNTGIEGGAQVDVTFLNDLEVGTFAVAYGWDAERGIYTTPFTESGLVTGPPVPEPSTILLLGAGFLGLAAFGRKRITK